MLRPHGSSSTGFAAVNSQQACQRPQHAALQRCHSLLVRQSATGSGGATTQQQQQQQAVAEAEVALQQLQQQQWQQEQLKQPPQLLPLGRQEEPASSSYSSSSSNSGSTAVGVDAFAEASSSGRDLQVAGIAAAVTWSITNAGSLQRLEAVVELHAPNLNCIHISAAFVQLQRLWPHAASSSSCSSSSSSSSSSNSPAVEDAWLSSPSNGSSSSSSTSSSSSSSSITDELATGRRLLPRLQSLALTVGRIDSRFVANVLHALAVLQSDRGERGAYNAALVNRLCSAAYSLANSMPLQELATVAWSLACLAVVPAPSLLRRLVSNVLRQVGGGAKPQDLLMLLNALPALHQTPGVVAPYVTVHKLAAVAGRVMAAASGHEAAGLLAALGGLEWRAPPAWLQAYWGAVAPKLAGMGWEQLGMTGCALGQLAPLSAAPDAAWLEAWEGVLSQQLVAADTGSSSSSGSSRVPLVELVMVLYGWSKALPNQPPSEQLQQLVFSSTQQALRSSSSPSSSLSLKQQRHQLQQQRQQQHSQWSPAWRQPMKQQLHLHAAAEEQQSSSVVHQPAHSSSSQQPAGVSPRLLGELVSAMARWRLLPPRQWLLAYLSAAQQQLLAGSCSVRDLSAVLWGLATLGVRPKTPWLDLASSAVEQQMGVQAQAVQQLQRQQRVWQQQRTQEWAQQQQRQQHRSRSEQPAASSSLLSLRPGLQEASPHHRSVVERLGAGSQQQLQQYRTTPKQLAVLLWSLHQLQYRPSGAFWDHFWALSLLLLPGQYNARDLAMTLEAVAHHQQQPPQQWVKAAMLAGAAVHPRERQRPAAATQQQQQQQQQGLAVTSSSSERAADTAQQQRWYSRDVLRMLVGFARLGAVLQPGHTWCAGVLDNAVRPVLQCLSAQDLCQLLWALGCCGYRPAGRALPAWLHTHLAAALAPASSSSSSSSSSGEGLFPGLSAEASVQLLVGLRRARVVMNRRWLGATLQASLAAAPGLPLQVWVQLLAYVASTGLHPPASWTAAVVDVLPDFVASCQLQQQQEQQAEKVRQQGPVQLLSVLSSLRRMQLVLPQPTLTLLQQAVAVAVVEAGLPSEMSSKMQQHLAALEMLHQQQ